MRYQVAPAERSGLPDQCLDLISVAQALHWFQLDPFHAEASRVLKPAGILAVWCYGRVRISPALDDLLDLFHEDILGPYWPPERRWVETGYRDLPFPFPELPAPPFALTATWDRDELLGYLDTWSAVKGYRTARGEDPLDWLRPRLADRWANPAERRAIRWPLSLRVGRLGG